MTPDRMKETRETLGLTQAGLAHCLGLTGADRSVARWEAGTVPIPAPVQIVVALWRARPELIHSQV